MKKKAIIAAMITIALAGYAIYWAFYDMSRLPTGELISEVQSPGGTYTLKSYRTDGGATTSYAIRGELNFNTENNSQRISTGNTELKTQQLNGWMMIQ